VVGTTTVMGMGMDMHTNRHHPHRGITARGGETVIVKGNETGREMKMRCFTVGVVVVVVLWLLEIGSGKEKGGDAKADIVVVRQMWNTKRTCRSGGEVGEVDHQPSSAIRNQDGLVNEQEFFFKLGLTFFDFSFQQIFMSSSGRFPTLKGVKVEESALQTVIHLSLLIS